jgi:hypothetical protein
MPSPTRYYSSNAAKTTLANSISNVSSSLELTAATNLPVQYPFTLILEKDTANEEVVEVTGLVGTAYQITRNIDSSGAKAHSVGALVEHGVSARDFTESRVHESSATAHGVTGDMMGTGGSQTVTGTKTFNSINITAASAINANNFKVINVSTPTSSSDAVNKGYVDSISGSAQDAIDAAELAEDWAIKTTGTVDGVDFSAKYWALQANPSSAVTDANPQLFMLMGA